MFGTPFLVPVAWRSPHHSPGADLCGSVALSTEARKNLEEEKAMRMSAKDVVKETLKKGAVALTEETRGNLEADKVCHPPVTRSLFPSFKESKPKSPLSGTALFSPELRQMGGMHAHCCVPRCCHMSYEWQGVVMAFALPSQCRLLRINKCT